MNEYAKSMQAENKIGKMAEYVFEIVDLPIRNHPQIAAFCRRKRKRWIKRATKMGITTYLVTRTIK